MSSPEVMREALLFDNAYLYPLLRARRSPPRRRAVAAAPRPGASAADRRAGGLGARAPGRHHVVGSVFFGVGWAVADACPGPIATQVGQGVLWSLFTIAGVVAGMVLAQRVSASAGERVGGSR